MARFAPFAFTELAQPFGAAALEEVLDGPQLLVGERDDEVRPDEDVELGQIGDQVLGQVADEPDGVGHHDLALARVEQPVALFEPRHDALDGFAGATWKVERARGRATLVIRPFERLLEGDRDALAKEGIAMLDFLAPDADDRDVRFERGR